MHRKAAFEQGQIGRSAAQRMGVADELAHEIAGAVLEVTATWRDHMTDAGVGASDLALLERCFALHEVVERWHDKAVKAADV